MIQQPIASASMPASHPTKDPAQDHTHTAHISARACTAKRSLAYSRSQSHNKHNKSPIRRVQQASTSSFTIRSVGAVAAMDSQSDADASTFTSPLPSARALMLPQPPHKRARFSSSSVNATRLPEASRPRLAISTDIRSCPAGRTFRAPKQRTPAYWQFIVCVADEKYSDVPTDQLTRDHAKSFYCLKCDKEMLVKKGKSVAGPHMLLKCVEDVRVFEAAQQRENEIEVSRQLVDILKTSGASEQDQFNTILAEWVSKDVRPMSIVGDAGLAKAVQFANNAKSRLVVSSCQTVTACLRTKAGQYRYSLRNRLGDVDKCDFYSVSSDIWTSIKCKSFISLTLHYVDAIFDMHSWTLEVRKISGKYDRDAIARFISRCFAWWRLDPLQCVRFVRDGASHMKCACTKLGLRHMSCAAHSLHLVVAAALVQKSKERNCSIPANTPSVHEDNTLSAREHCIADVAAFVDASPPAVEFAIHESGRFDGEMAEHDEFIDMVEKDQQQGSEVFVSDADIDCLCDEVAAFVKIVEKASSDKISSANLESVRKSVRSCRKISEYFRRSQKGANRLETLQFDKKEPRAVMIDCSTRWNSTLSMLQRFVELQSTLQSIYIYLGSSTGKKEFDDPPSKKLKPPTSEQWFTIQCLIELLVPFSVATERVDAETYPTLVSLYCVIATVKIMLGNSKMFDELYASVNTESFAPRELSMMQSVRQSFLVLMEKRIDNNLDNDLLWISLLDPYMTNTGLFTAGEFNQAKMRMIAEICRVKRAAVGASCQSQQPSFQNPEKIVKSANDRAQRSFQQLLYAGRMKRQAVETREDKIEADCEWELGNIIKLSAEAEVKKNATKPRLHWRGGNCTTKSFQRLPLLRVSG